MKFHGTVLVVDDEPHIRKYVALVLKSIGLSSVLEAGDGEEAIGVYQQKRPELVLLDINMPRMNGIDTLRQLKAINPDCVVVMLTSLANRHTVEQALELGASHYLRKDTPKEEIAQALTETIAQCFPAEEPRS